MQHMQMPTSTENTRVVSAVKPRRHKVKQKFTYLFAVVTTLILACALCLSGCATSSQNSIRIGWMPWDEDVAITFLWKELLEDRGYDVELTLAEIGPIFESVSSGGLDLYLDAWSPDTHRVYFEKYGDKIENIATWYNEASLAWTVPSYVDINSIEEVAANKELFGNRIIGIEPGAGLMMLSQEQVIPTYGLEDMELVQGSTVAMLAELDRATKAQEPILVTLWHPHWVYSNYDLKDLEDPQGTLGESEECQIISRMGFSEDFPEVTKWFKNFKMSDTQLAELEDVIINQYGANHEAEGARAWIEDPQNKELIDSWFTE